MAVIQAGGDGVVQLSREDTNVLSSMAEKSEKKRSRICAHPNPENTLHEMLIWLDAATYIRPHRHIGKSESFHIIEGRLKVVLFRENGDIDRIIPMGDYQSGLPFFYRLESPVYHTVIPGDTGVLIHETTNGPFQVNDAEFASWAPAEHEGIDLQKKYEEILKIKVARFDFASEIDAG